MGTRNNWISRVTLGKNDAPDLTLDKLPSSRWQIFKDIFFSKMWIVFRVNLTVLMFCAPALACLAYYNFTFDAFFAQVGFSANLGLGTAAQTDADQIADTAVMWGYFGRDLIMIPLYVIGSLGFAGAFRLIKLMVWKENATIKHDFFQGIRDNWAQFLLIFLLVGVGVMLINLNINIYKALSSEWYNIVGIVCTIIFVVLFAIMAMFMLCQCTTYKLSFKTLVKNSWIFSISLMPLNVIFLVAALFPLILMLIFSPLTGLVAMFYIFVGFSYSILVFTLYTSFVFEKFAKEKLAVALKDKEVYAKAAQKQKNIQEAKKQTKYVNPKKRKKIQSIDEGSTFTPLEQAFSRSDLQRLAQEKEQIYHEDDQKDNQD